MYHVYPTQDICIGVFLNTQMKKVGPDNSPWREILWSSLKHEFRTCLQDKRYKGCWDQSALQCQLSILTCHDRDYILLNTIIVSTIYLYHYTLSPPCHDKMHEVNELKKMQALRPVSLSSHFPGIISNFPEYTAAGQIGKIVKYQLHRQFKASYVYFLLPHTMYISLDYDNNVQNKRISNRKITIK